MSKNFKDIKVLVRGAGDIASGVIWNLAYAGFKVCCTDIEEPSCIRTEVSYSNAIYEGNKIIDGIKCIYIKNANEIEKTWVSGNVPLIVDEEAKVLNEIKFDVIVDAILAKKNLGLSIDMAELVIAVGPGFTANKDCHVVVETMRGHNLAKIYNSGSAAPNTGVPGLIASHGADRVMHSPADGIMHNIHKIGDVVASGEILSVIEEKNGNKVNMIASIDGVLRGILKDGYKVTKGLKAADIDPRISEKDNCFSISDKARAIGATVLVAIMHKYNI